MRFNSSLFLATLLLFGIPNFLKAQAPVLGAAESFAIFTAAGAFGNTGATIVTGDIGTNVGAFAGFPPGIVIGSIHVADGVSAVAATDVDLAYAYVDGLTCGIVLGNTTLGNGQTLTPDIYCLGAQSILNGTLVFDAQGNPDAIFIIQIDGAFSTNTLSNVQLINGANACNIYFQINGAVELGIDSDFAGTILANGAISFLFGASLEGRALSRQGAISLNTNIVTLNAAGCSCNLAVICPSPDGGTFSCIEDVPPADPASIQVTDSCDVITITFSDQASGSGCGSDTMFITRSYFITDGVNTNTCTQTIEVIDSAIPSITCPANVTVQCASLVPAPNTAAVITSDNCDGVVTVTVAPDVITNQTCANRYNINRIYTATDACGNSASCTQTITVFDNTGPTITCPANVTVQCASLVPASNTAGIVTSDNCGGTATVTVASDAITNQTCANRYTIARVYTATDACGNTTTCAQIITVFDNIVPTITCPANVTVQCASLVPVANTAAVVTSDNCGGTATVTVASDVITNQTCANRYTITRVYTATDACGNIASCTQTISVFDNTAPMITCPVNVTVQCASLVPVANTAAVVTSDNCGGTATVTVASDVITNQTCANRYTITRVYTATDACGNTASCTQTISVFDNTAPMITCPVNVTVQCASLVPPSNAAAVVTSDNCGGAATVTFAPDVITNQTCANRYTITRVYTATDACGNSASCSQTITVFDNTAPSITCPANVTVQCASLVPASNTAGIVTSDNCSGTATVTVLPDVITNQTCANRYTITRMYRATDICGNSATCAQIITVFDNIAPTITCPVNVTVQCASLVPAPNTSAVVTSDNCGSATVTVLPDIITNQTCVNRYTITRVYRTTDLCGNSATCAQIITVFDNIAPTINFIEPLLVGVPNGGTISIQCMGQDPDWDIPMFDEGSIAATDNCGGSVQISFTQTMVDEGNCEDDGYINLQRLMWIVTDACGNSGSAFVFMELIDTIPPVILGVPNDTTVNCSNIPAVPASIYATDECLCACVILFEESEPAEGCLNGTVMFRSWTATDACGNETIVTQRITLVDDTGSPLELIHPSLVGTVDGAILEYTCNEGGIPEFYESLDVDDVNALFTCGGDTEITFSSASVVANNCEFWGFVEERTFEWMALDECGNTSLFQLRVRLVDDEAPVLLGVPEMTCPGDPLLDLIEAGDNCNNASIRFWDVVIDNPCNTGSAIRRTYEAFDGCGNMALDTVILIPENEDGPVMHFVNPLMVNMDPDEILTLECNGANGSYSNFSPDDVLFEGTCNLAVNVEFTETVLSTGDCTDDEGIALLELKWTGTDGCGNSASVVVMANVVDTSPPQFNNFHSSVAIGCNDPLPSMDISDNCGTVLVSIIDTTINSNCEGEYKVRRLISATDECGNISTRLQTIQVGNDGGPLISGVDIEVCNDLTMPVVTAYDECLEQFVHVTMVQDTIESVCHDGIVIERIWSATDHCGNTSAVHQTIIMNDFEAPEIMVPTYSVIGLFVNNLNNRILMSQTDLFNKLNLLDGNSVFILDECDVEIDAVFNVESLQGNCITDGYFERRNYYWIATDVCGNIDSLAFSVDIMDDVAPVFVTTPADITIICAPLPDPGFVQVTDIAMPVNISYAETILETDIVGTFLVIRTWIATDACGNIAQYNQRITWIPDTFLECNIIVPPVIECNSHGVIIASAITGGMGAVNYEWEIVGEKCFIQSGQGTPELAIYIGFSSVKLILTITDSFGCVSMCMVIIDCLNASDIQLVNEAQVNYQTESQLRTEAVYEESYLLISDLNIWPNPTNHVINVGFTSLNESLVEIAVLNLLGQVILSKDIPTVTGYNSLQLGITGVPKGSYVIEIKTVGRIFTRRIIIN